MLLDFKKALPKLFVLSGAIAATAPLYTSSALAVPACPDWETVSQNGETFQIRMQGDEFGSWTEADDGSVVMKGSGNAWYFSENKNNKAEKSSQKFSKRSKPTKALNTKEYLDLKAPEIKQNTKHNRCQLVQSIFRYHW
jgi:hypothetical protein